MMGVAGISCAAQMPETNADMRPNIVSLLADDQNSLSVGCYGNPEVRTPQMDRLGHDGIIFDRTIP